MTEAVIDDDDDQDRLAQCGELFNIECIYYDVDDLKDVTVPGRGECSVASQHTKFTKQIWWSENIVRLHE